MRDINVNENKIKTAKVKRTDTTLSTEMFVDANPNHSLVEDVLKNARDLTYGRTSSVFALMKSVRTLDAGIEDEDIKYINPKIKGNPKRHL